ncbi:MAG: sugar ABC transporter substrate-binding protein [Solirubrobacterales bacterium]
MPRKGSFATLGATAVVATALAVAGCGGSDDGNTATSTGDGGVDQAQLEELYAGTFGKPPESGPKPKAGQKVWLISCGQALISCSAPIASAEEAAKSLGWETRVVDGKLDPNVYANGVRQAVAAGADGIITFAIDCALVKQPLAEAEKANIPTVSMESINCPSGGYSSVVDYQEGDFKTWETQWGATKAVYIANKTDGKAKVIDFYNDETQASALIDVGFLAELKKCPGCKVVERVAFTGAELGPKLQQKAEQALLKNPDANAIQIPFDAATLTGIGAAIKASGRGKELVTVGGEGYAPAADLVRQGVEQKAGSGSAGGWEGYAAVDTMNRLLNGEEAAPSGIGLQLFDADNNLGKTGGWEPPVDYKAAYAKTWGTTP